VQLDYDCSVCILETVVSNPGLGNCPQPPQLKAGTIPRSGHNLFLSNPFQITVHKLAHNSILYNPVIDQRPKLWEFAYVSSM
jgi:hypothetical protein